MMTQTLQNILKLWLFIQPAVLFAQPNTSEFHTPENFFWRSFESENQIRYELWSFTGKPSDIFFSWDRQTQSFLEGEKFDPTFELYLPGPFQTPYYAHPDKDGATSLEDEFLRILHHYKLSDRSPETQNIWTQRIELEFDGISIREDILSLDELVQWIESQIKLTEDWALKSFGLSQNLPGRKWLSNFNPVEAIYSEEGPSSIRLDAFNLSPVQALADGGEEILNALKDLRSQPARYLLEWFMASSQFSIQTRLSVLMLVTHNHMAEDWFVYACVAQYGIHRAWEAFQDINEIYKNERIFWKDYAVDYKQVSHLPSHTSPLKGVEWVDVSPQRMILSPLYGVDSLGEDAKVQALPFVQLYHYYGAFILSYILAEEKELPRALLPSLVERFGITYKLKTAAFNSDQIKKMRMFYRTGAEHYLFLRNFIRH